jgi:hypothetical protein
VGTNYVGLVGGKVTISSAAEGTPFDAVAMLHPAYVPNLLVTLCFGFEPFHRMLSVSDAQKLTIPIAIYISNDEPIDEVRFSSSTLVPFLSI